MELERTTTDLMLPRNLRIRAGRDDVAGGGDSNGGGEELAVGEVGGKATEDAVVGGHLRDDVVGETEDLAIELDGGEIDSCEEGLVAQPCVFEGNSALDVRDVAGGVKQSEANDAAGFASGSERRARGEVNAVGGDTVVKAGVVFGGEIIERLAEASADVERHGGDAMEEGREGVDLVRLRAEFFFKEAAAVALGADGGSEPGVVADFSLLDLFTQHGFATGEVGQFAMQVVSYAREARENLLIACILREGTETAAA